MEVTCECLSGSVVPPTYRRLMSTAVEARAVPAAEVVRTLSPSRAAEFLACPLRYRFRVVDKLPEPASPEAVRGTLVHAVLERLFDLPRPDRTCAAAVAMLRPTWAELEREELTFPTEAAEQAWLASAEDLLGAYFELERPELLDPREREMSLQHEVAPGLVLRGIVDRLDEAPDGRTRVVDYKTGRAPGEAFEGRALFQVKFYALMLWRSTGRVPTELQLMYLADKQVLRYEPDAEELERFERTVLAVASAIRRAHESGRWEPKTSRLCGWCAHQALCPAMGGTLPFISGSERGIMGETPPSETDLACPS